MQRFFYGVIVLFACVLPSFGADMPEGFTTYTIQAGDTLAKIAPKETWDVIMKINRIDATSMQIGHTIYIPTDPAQIPHFCPVPESLPSAQEAREVFVFLNTQYFGAYENGTLVHWGPISSGGIGRETPAGTHRIMSKYRHYVSKKYGSPMPYAQCFDPQGGRFLHQQAMPGKPASHSCIRLLMSDAKWLFAWTKVGDKITIQ